MRNNFSLAEVAQMTMPQVEAYVTSILKMDKTDYLNKMGMIRAAHHADEKAYKKLVRELQRE